MQILYLIIQYAAPVHIVLLFIIQITKELLSGHMKTNLSEEFDWSHFPTDIGHVTLPNKVDVWQQGEFDCLLARQHSCKFW